MALVRLLLVLQLWSGLPSLPSARSRWAAWLPTVVLRLAYRGTAARWAEPVGEGLLVPYGTTVELWLEWTPGRRAPVAAGPGLEER